MTVREILGLCKNSETTMELEIQKKVENNYYEVLMSCKKVYWENIRDDILDDFVESFYFNDCQNKLVIICEENS